MSKTIFWSHCPAHVKPMICNPNRYRSYTGHCNNLDHPSWGAANTPFVRYLPPVYSDGKNCFFSSLRFLLQLTSIGIDGLRESVVRNRKLPHPRVVTRSIHRDFDRPSNDMTILLMSWGQFIDHDLALAMPPRCNHFLITWLACFSLSFVVFIDGKETEIDCCKLAPGQSHPLCMPFEIPPNDPVYGITGRSCHDFKRSIAGHRPNCALGPRVHVNTLTAFIDANFIYGSTKAVALRLRTFRKGLRD